MSQLPPYDDDVMPTQADDDGFEEEDFEENRKEILTRLRNNYAGWRLEPATFGPLLQTIRDGEKFRILLSARDIENLREDDTFCHLIMDAKRMAIPLICCYVDANVSLGARSIFEQAVDAPPESDPDLSDIILSQDDRFETLSADHIYIVRNRNAVAQGLVAIFQACEDDWSGKEDAQYLREEMATLVQMYSYLQTAEDVFDALTTA